MRRRPCAFDAQGKQPESKGRKGPQLRLRKAQNQIVTPRFHLATLSQRHR